MKDDQKAFELMSYCTKNQRNVNKNKNGDFTFAFVGGKY